MQIYRDDRCGFEISYPADYVVAHVQPANQQPQPVCKVHFLSALLAQSETAALQPPELSIEVFTKRDDGQTLEQWLISQQLSTSNDHLTPYTLAGLTGVQVSSQTLVAPNTFMYVSHGTQVYRFISLSPTSDQMLTTFKLVN